MGPSTVRKLRAVAIAIVVAALVPVAPVDAQTSPEATQLPPPGDPVPVLPARVVRAALLADGAVVRRDERVTVERVVVGAETVDPGDDARVFRVTVRGRFRARALRYVVLAGGEPVGYAVPRFRERSIVAITDDPAVRRAPIRVRYGTSPAAGPAELPRRAPAPVGRGSLADPPGPYDVVRTSYDFGDRAFQPAGLGGRVELRADVHHPADLTAGPFPLVLFLHGNHSSCWRGDRAGYRWPCPSGWRPIPNHEGYAYVARRLASYGFVVASVSGNGVNVLGNMVEDTGMRQRGELLEKHVDLWQAWATTGGEPFGTAFVGAVDLDRIGVMGHSRGGEGAVWQVIVDRERPSPYGIDAVLALAPVDFTRVAVGEVPLGVILPYCDGDVSDLQGVHFFDDARYLVPGDPAPKATVTAFGANHNFFNTVWSPSSGIPGSFDDGWRCRGRLTEREQRRMGAVYVTSFFRRFVGAAAQRGRVWSGELTPASIAPATTAVTYLPPDDPASRLDVDRFTHPRDLATTELGGEVTATDMGVYAWCSNVYDSPCVPGDLSWTDVHLSWSWFGVPGPGLQEGVLGWSEAADGGASVRFDLGGDHDVSGYDHLTFRTAPNPGYWSNLDFGYQDLVVVLEDADGDRAEVAAADVGNDVLRFPLERRRMRGHVIMNQIRFPLGAFAGVDLDAIVAVELAFSRTRHGVIGVSDLNFVAGETG